MPSLCITDLQVKMRPWSLFFLRALQVSQKLSLGNSEMLLYCLAMINLIFRTSEKPLGKKRALGRGT